MRCVKAVGMRVVCRLPPSLQKGEGYLYDITTHTVKNEELYALKEVIQEVLSLTLTLTLSLLFQARGPALLDSFHK